jgi:hypothetical protein
LREVHFSVSRLLSGIAEAQAAPSEQFQEKCVAVFRPELRKTKSLERFRVSVKNGNAPAKSIGLVT